MSWPRGQDEINAMLDSGELGRITADLDLAKHLTAEARRHVKSAEVLASADPSLAYAALHDAIRKSLAAMLQAQGLRATTSGGHLAVQRAVRAQFQASMGTLLRPIDRIRVLRHTLEYPDSPTWLSEDEIRDEIPYASAIVEAAAKAIDHLPVYTAWSAKESDA